MSSASLRRLFCSSSAASPSRTLSPHHSPLYFSGIQPTGIPHLGNYFGFIEPWLQLQKDLPPTTGMILSVVDQHAISLGPIPAAQLRSDTRRMAAGLLACGVCPERTLLFRQSDVPQIAQLSWILGSLQTVTKLQRMPQYKEKASKFSRGEVPVGLLTYPVLQAADVMIFKASHVPVGADQSQHMNLLSDLAYHFNMKYETDYFPIPQQVTRSVSARVRSLRDPLKKMSKSDPSQRSRIDISDPPEAVLEKCRKAVSDSRADISYDPVERPAVSNLVDLYCAVSGCSIDDVIGQGWVTSELKNRLAERVQEKLGPIRERIEELEQGSMVDDILHQGGLRARSFAKKNMQEIRQIIGFL